MHFRFPWIVIYALCAVVSGAAFGCAADTTIPVPEPGVTTTGCVVDESTPNMLEELCANPSRFMSRRVVLSGDWQEIHASACSLVLCRPGVCCNECYGAGYQLPCPGGSRTISLRPAAALDLPVVAPECPETRAGGCIGTNFGCTGPADGAPSPCDAEWLCTPAVATLCSAAGTVTDFSATFISVSVDAVDLTVAP